MNITGSTQLLGIIGYPIKHVLSPVMHNKMFELLYMDWIYVPIEVSPKNLAQVVEGLRYSNIRGFSVTIPHKVSIIPMLDNLDPYAARIGAVNTVKIEDCKLKGKNTDGAGAIQSLLEHDFPLRNASITILGAGGAARALIYYLLDYTKDICIVNRTNSRLSDLVNEINGRIGDEIYSDEAKITGILLNEKELLRKRLTHSDLIINATSVGMFPQIDESPIPNELIPHDSAVFDVIYTPYETKLLKIARNKGCRILNGVEMLVNQGAIAFEWWTQHKADKEEMKRIVLKWLQH